MHADSFTRLSGGKILAYLGEAFPGRHVISTSEFREFLSISPSTDQRMRALGQYPPTIALPGIMREKRIMLVDFAAWLEKGGCEEDGSRTPKKRGRGSEAWKRSHPKETAAEEA